MAKALDSANCAYFKSRIERVTAGSERRWGGFTPPGMLAHLRTVLEMSLGELPCEDHSTFFSRNVILFMAVRVMPFPKGIKAPAKFTPDARELAMEHQALNAKLDQFMAALEKEPSRVTLHQVFGPMTLRYWSLLHGKHFDHHLRQFGA